MKPRNAELSDKQKAYQKRFSEAVKKAKTILEDATQKAHYEQAAKKVGKSSAYNYLISELMKKESN